MSDIGLEHIKNAELKKILCLVTNNTGTEPLPTPGKQARLKGQARFNLRLREGEGLLQGHTERGPEVFERYRPLWWDS